MTLRFSIRDIWLAIQFVFRKIPAGVWIFLAIIEVVIFAGVTHEISKTDGLISDLSAQGSGTDPLKWMLGHLQRDQISSLVLAPIFLILAKIRFSVTAWKKAKCE